MKITEIENGLKGIEILNRYKDETQTKVDKLVALIVQRDFPILAKYIHCPFHWECEESPFGWCVYDENIEGLETDSCWNYCLYCNKPYERK